MASTINCGCHSIRSMFRVLGIYNFGVCKIYVLIECFAVNNLLDIHFNRQIFCIKWMPGKGYLNFFPTKLQFCSSENQLNEIFCWTWYSVLLIMMSNVIDVFCIFFCIKEINKSTEEAKNMLSKQAYGNRKRYDQILCMKNL